VSGTPPTPGEPTAEEEFLLRSLADLEAERMAGNIDAETYRVLHDDYTARAAMAIRTRTGEAPALPPPAPRRLRVVTVGGIAVFCVLAALALARAVGDRAPGQTPTGNGQVAAPARTDLGAAVRERPDDYVARVAYARSLFGAGDLAGAIEQYSEANRIDPEQPEPLAYRGWLLALAAGRLPAGTDRQALSARADADVEQALTVDPSYPDSYAFQGVIALRFRGEPTAAVAPLQRFLVLVPDDHPMRGLVLSALEAATAAAGTTAP